MAWPATPLATFVNASAPACDATFLNNLQSGINGLVTGMYSFRSLTTDGAGGAAIAGGTGTIVASSTVQGLAMIATYNVGGSSLPTIAIAKGTLYKDMIPLAAGAVRYGGGSTYTLDWGFGVTSIAQASTGVINVTLQNAAASVTNAVVIATINHTPGTAASGDTCQGIMASSGTIAQVRCYNSAAAAKDDDFYFAVYGA
jgi:hypothetical protein